MLHWNSDIHKDSFLKYQFQQRKVNFSERKLKTKEYPMMKCLMWKKQPIIISNIRKLRKNKANSLDSFQNRWKSFWFKPVFVFYLGQIFKETDQVSFRYYCKELNILGQTNIHSNAKCLNPSSILPISYPTVFGVSMYAPMYVRRV